MYGLPEAIEKELHRQSLESFGVAVIALMEQRQHGLEDAIAEARRQVNEFAEHVGPEATAVLAEEATIAAEWLREKIKSARELVELADRT